MIIVFDSDVFDVTSHKTENFAKPKDHHVQEPRQENEEIEEKSELLLSKIDNKEETQDKTNLQISIAETTESTAEESSVTLDDGNDSFSLSKKNSSSHQKGSFSFVIVELIRSFKPYVAISYNGYIMTYYTSFI